MVCHAAPTSMLCWANQSNAVQEPNPKRLKTESEATNGTYKAQTPTKRVTEALYSESVVARLWHVAAKALGSVSYCGSHRRDTN